MAKKMDGFWIFSTETQGYNKAQVMESIGKVYGEYEKLFAENIKLKNNVKALKAKLEADKKN